jgi:hypothetical protein
LPIGRKPVKQDALFSRVFIQLAELVGIQGRAWMCKAFEKTLVSGTANPNSNVLQVFRQQEGVCGARKLAKVGCTLIQQ